jgi:hypothetical protein
MPEPGPVGANPGINGPLGHAQAGMLVETEEATELQVVIVPSALEPPSEITHGIATLPISMGESVDDINATAREQGDVPIKYFQTRP